ncbi:MAG: hypothetical protein SF051_12660 [Elusimicrobiota bacterium]|nr:hypothetical protein [Elusimicrobiota bacterium]
MTGRLARLVPDWAAGARAEDTAYLVRLFYGALLAIGLGTIYEMGTSLRVFMTDSQILLWPAWWARREGPGFAVPFVSVLLAVGAFAGALWPGRRWARVLACVGLWEYVAVLASYANLFPVYNQWAAVAFVFIFLPDRWDEPGAAERDREAASLVVWAALALFLLTYSMAGLSKFLMGVWQASRGELTVFGAAGAKRLFQVYQSESGHLGPLGSVMMQEPALYAPLHLAVTLVQLAALAAAWRPSWHRAAGAGVIAFHAATFLMLGIFFKQSALLAALLLLGSPFVNAKRD